MKQILLFAALSCAVPAFCRSGLSDDQLPFVSTYCLDCHSGADAEADLDLERLSFSLDDPVHFNRFRILIVRLLGFRKGQTFRSQPYLCVADKCVTETLRVAGEVTRCWSVGCCAG